MYILVIDGKIRGDFFNFTQAIDTGLSRLVKDQSLKQFSIVKYLTGEIIYTLNTGEI